LKKCDSLLHSPPRLWYGILNPLFVAVNSVSQTKCKVLCLGDGLEWQHARRGRRGRAALHDRARQRGCPLLPHLRWKGNVSEYVSSSGVEVAHFEYDPFGNLTVDTHANAAQFPYRFSTKPQDGVTGLYYYGYRWYDPATGRWPRRDPNGERGGLNLYGFVGNDSLNKWDLLGLRWPGVGEIDGPTPSEARGANVHPTRGDLVNPSGVDPSIFRKRTIIPPVEGLGAGEYDCCDDKPLRDAGESSLNDRYGDIEKGLVAESVPRRGEPDDISCHGINTRVSDLLAFDGKTGIKYGIPKCWECHVEHRSRDFFSTLMAMLGNTDRQTTDHWVVVCVSRNSGGGIVKEISFDYWDDMHVAGSDPDLNFRRTFYKAEGFENREAHHYVCGQTELKIKGSNP
jgi:RHS repeat-associated protein